eukprot:TRINITY_DN103250_c0_g1_i1.p1 TRINITY_DN103250_c0_g1~~TRINITY_DN103250_c0_g1_i1.p1  ORF type:complete len:196 (+),score=27.32 TRINITY_DN103250_c0_g1_i1:58-588(+)
MARAARSGSAQVAACLLLGLSMSCCLHSFVPPARSTPNEHQLVPLGLGMLSMADSALAAPAPTPVSRPGLGTEGDFTLDKFINGFGVTGSMGALGIPELSWNVFFAGVLVITLGAVFGLPLLAAPFLAPPKTMADVKAIPNRLLPTPPITDYSGLRASGVDQKLVAAPIAKPGLKA